MTKRDLLVFGAGGWLGQARRMCEQLLVNELIEEFEVDGEDGGPPAS